MNWFGRVFKTGNERRETKDGGRQTSDENVLRPTSYVSHPSSLNCFLLLFRAVRICAVALVAVSGSLWIAWAAQDTFTQGDWTTATPGATQTLPATNYNVYDSKDPGVVAGADVRLQSSSYTATDDGTLTTTGTPSATGGTFAAGTSTATNTAVSGTGAGAKVALTWVWACGDPLTVNHTTAGGVAPEDKTVTYGTVSTTLGGTGSKCWITQNLGATTNAASATENTEPNAGWYWQFNLKQGYKHDGTTRTPSTGWITSIDESSDWISANDPCTIELGAGWRLPTSAEWTNADSTGAWTSYTGTYASVLKLHTAGWLSNGALNFRGSNGYYWGSTQSTSTGGYLLSFSSSSSAMSSISKAVGISVRCLKD